MGFMLHWCLIYRLTSFRFSSPWFWLIISLLDIATGSSSTNSLLFNRFIIISKFVFEDHFFCSSKFNHASTSLFFLLLNSLFQPFLKIRHKIVEITKVVRSSLHTWRFFLKWILFVFFFKWINLIFNDLIKNLVVLAGVIKAEYIRILTIPRI